MYVNEYLGMTPEYKNICVSLMNAHHTAFAVEDTPNNQADKSTHFVTLKFFP